MPYSNTWTNVPASLPRRNSVSRSRQSMSSYSPEVKSSLEVIHKYLSGERLVPELNNWENRGRGGAPHDVMKLDESQGSAASLGLQGKTLDFNSLASTSPNPQMAGHNSSFRSISPARGKLAAQYLTSQPQPLQPHPQPVPQPQLVAPVQPATAQQQQQLRPVSPNSVFSSNVHHPPVHTFHSRLYTTLTLTDIVNFLRWHYSIDKAEEEAQLRRGEGISTLSEEDIISLTSCFTEELLQDKRTGNFSYMSQEAPSDLLEAPQQAYQQLQPVQPQQYAQSPTPQPQPLPQQAKPQPQQREQQQQQQQQPELYPTQSSMPASQPEAPASAARSNTGASVAQSQPPDSTPSKPASQQAPEPVVQLQPVRYPVRQHVAPTPPVPPATLQEPKHVARRASDTDLGTNPTVTQPMHPPSISIPSSLSQEDGASTPDPTPVHGPSSLPTKARATPPSVVTPRSRSSSLRRSCSLPTTPKGSTVPLTPKMARSPSNPAQLTPKGHHSPHAPFPHPQPKGSPSPPRRSPTLGSTYSSLPLPPHPQDAQQAQMAPQHGLPPQAPTAPPRTQTPSAQTDSQV